ncbi:MAG: transposase [bacterium]
MTAQVPTGAGSSPPARSPLRMQGMRTTFVTLNTQGHQPVFTEARIINVHLEVLRHLSDRMDMPVICYCYMPDHAHLMIASDQPRRLHAFIRAYKRQTWTLYRRESRKPLWERANSFYHLRKDEDLLKMAQFILENPVRAGLRVDYRDYPFSGSFLWDLKVRESRNPDGLHPVPAEQPTE